MKTFWNTSFKKRDYECTNIVAIRAIELPKGYDPNVWKQNGYDVKSSMELQQIDIVYQSNERFERYGYL